MPNKLLCTYGHNTDLDLIIDYILVIYSIQESDIEYYFTNEDDLVYCFYTNTQNEFARSFNTISIHKKRRTNTYYTINAMNYLICEHNNGILDYSYQLNWGNYTNSILLHVGTNIKKLSIFFE